MIKKYDKGFKKLQNMIRKKYDKKKTYAPPPEKCKKIVPAPGIEPATKSFQDRFAVGSIMLPLKWLMVCMGPRG